MSDSPGPVARILRIARWEIETSGGTIDKRTAIAFLIALLLVGAAAPVLMSGGVALDEDIYRVAVADDHEYTPAIEDHDALRLVTDQERADLIVTEHGVERPTTRKGEAALAELDDAVRSYNNRQLRAEEDQAAAFPVVVELTQRSRETGTTEPGVPESGTEDGETADDDPPPESDDGTTDRTDDGVDESADETETEDQHSDAEPRDDSTADDQQTTDHGDDDSDGVGQNDDDGLVDTGGLFDDTQTGTPAEIDPPFPFEPLILAFLFIVPMNFVIQAYGSTIINERLNRRGELLLVTPASPAEIVTGKTLPYLGALVGLTALIALAVHPGVGGVLSVLAVFPLALLFLAATFVGAMFARSYKELTFVTVTISVFLTTYAFVPAIFSDVTEIALISPLTLVVRDLQGAGVTAIQYGFSTGPVYLSSLVLFVLGLGVYREEDMFTQRPIHLKLLDALAAHVHRPLHVLVFTAVLIPFVFLVQLLSVAVLFPLPVEIGFLILLVIAATVEEIAKSIHVFAGYEHDRFDRTLSMALLLGALAGTGFFIAEKLAHAGQLVGLDNQELGQAVFQIGLDVGPLLWTALFLLPLVLHTVTATISMLGARRSPVAYVVALGLAIIVHVAYNLGVLLYVF